MKNIFTHEEILSFIKLIRLSFKDAAKVYTEGSCLYFSMILEYVFPGGQILWNEDHSLYEYREICYDITGEVKKTKQHINLKDNYPLCEIYKKILN